MDSVSSDPEPLGRLRAIATLLPEAVEVNLLGDVAFRVAATTFALVPSGTEPVMVHLKLSTQAQAEWCQRDGCDPAPETGHHGWTCVILDGRVAWDDVDELVVASYRLLAPDHLRRVLATLIEASEPDA